MKEKIFAAIKEQNGKINFKNLSKKFDISTTELQQILLELKLDGIIFQSGNKYMLFPSDLYLGKITTSTSGRKYIFYNNKKIDISNTFINDVIIHDIVSFKINENNEAEIISIVHRELSHMTCEIKVIDGNKIIIPFYEGTNFTLPKEIMNTLYDGDIIEVSIEPTEELNYLNAKFIKKLGRRDDPSIDDLAIAINYGFDNDYTTEYMEEVKKLPTFVNDDDLKDRIDYRNQLVCTIDGINTKDMDDAVFGEVLPNGIIRIYVHIADVSHYIKKDSLIFQRACEKTTSLYMNNSVFHMLHHIISNGICSLNPNVDRLTKTIVMDIDKSGNIINFDIQKSVINSKKKMTYEDVDNVIIHGIDRDDYKPFQKQLFILYDAAIRLEKRYTEKNGKLAFASNELDISYYLDGSIKEIKDYDDTSISRKIIENLMIAANESVATWFSNMDIPSVYRIHELPDIMKINNVIMELNKAGYKIKPIRDIDNPKSLQKILNTLSKYEEYPIISQMLIMSMQRARYSVNNAGHYALGLDAYLHFTSPIRRLADLLVHMMSDIVLRDYEKITPEYLKECEIYLDKLARDASSMQIQADMAEKIAERRLILKKLEKHAGEIYEGTIIEVGKRIKIRVEGIDTYIDCHDLDSIFSFDPKRKFYYDKDTNTKIKIGTKVEIILKSASAISDRFTISILGIKKQDIKKKVLENKAKI